jgi:serine/threonine protein phosphatase PrpC
LNERILLCSDGLWSILSNDEISQVLRSNPEAADACRGLIFSARSKGAQDNITAIVIQLDEDLAEELSPDSEIEELPGYFEPDIEPET